MSSTQPRQRRRWLHRLIFRVIPALLIIAIFYFGGRVLGSAIAALNEQAEAQRRVPLYQATATAMATPESEVATPESEVKLDEDAVKPALQVFPTNTPQPGEPTAAPTLPQVTPRPLPTLFAYQGPEPGTIAGGTLVPTAVAAVDRRGQDLMNILLLGNDGEITGEGFFGTDTMIIVSVNRTAGTVAMLSLPRDLYVYIPGWTMQRLNTAFIRGESGGWTDGGFGLLRQTIFYNLGINIHYYAMVDLSGFVAIVDAVGGVNIAVDCAIQDFALVGAEVPSEAVRINEDAEYVLPVGYYHMSGAEALWYARSRGSSSDFDRGRRQQQVLRAVWRQARDAGLLTNAPNLWAQGSPYLRTDLMFEDLIGLVPLALSLDPSRIEQFRFRRLYDTQPWQTPNGDYVQLPIYDHILEMLTDFYTPPTTNQVESGGVSIRVWNGTSNANWDFVAADSLAWDGYVAAAAGAAPEIAAQTLLIDYTGSDKSSARDALAAALNIVPENIRIQPDPNRSADFDLIVGSDYNACDEPGILPTDPIPPQ